MIKSIKYIVFGMLLFIAGINMMFPGVSFIEKYFLVLGIMGSVFQAGGAISISIGFDKLEKIMEEKP